MQWDGSKLREKLCGPLRMECTSISWGGTSDQLVGSGYGSNYARLVEIKKKYDPKNVLRLNQNIKSDSSPNS